MLAFISAVLMFAGLREVSLATKQGTALYDGLLDGVQALADAGAGRRVLIVLTDGDDTSSKATATCRIRRSWVRKPASRFPTPRAAST